MLLASLSVGEAAPVTIEAGVVRLGPEAKLLPAAAGFALFDVDSPVLPRSAQVTLEFASTLDGRTYRAQRARGKPGQWTIHDRASGYLAASGRDQVLDWLRRAFRVRDGLALPRLFSDLVCFSLPVTLSLLMDEPAIRERKMAPLFRLERYPPALRQIDDVIGRLRDRRQEVAAEAKLLQGQASWSDPFRQRLQAARDAQAGLRQRADDLRRQLQAASEWRERRRSLTAELEAARQGIESRKRALAGLEAEAAHAGRKTEQLEQAQARLVELEAGRRAFEEADRQIKAASSALARRAAQREQLNAATNGLAAAQGTVAALEEQLAGMKEAIELAKSMQELVGRQESLEVQLAEAQERAMRLQAANRGMQDLLTELKRTEVLAGEVERQLQELGRSNVRAQRVHDMEQEMGALEAKLRDAVRQADELELVQGAARATSGKLQELRKAAAMTDRAALRVASTGAGEDRTVVGHLRDAIDQQLATLDTQVQAWERRAHDLSSAPMAANQLRASILKLQDELSEAREAERQLSTARALRQQQRHFSDRLDELKQAIAAFAREQQTCREAPGQVANLRHDLAAMGDPRAERRALERAAGRKEAVEAELRIARRRLEDRMKEQ
ncbi:MAG: hypothetical protein KGJ86_11420, partial [Chloroflexota bacterium]|nr:hypothetical protein [Chloroflexota bacterium]